ncbi:hypothetical protein HF521_021368 [Silurus meridionalis]|uniref:ALK and LTK ligand 2 n=1 Tax=Silurus meridionalis TaxID=175797 RepID=A0A8T0BFK0_SILME|nr:hypothetical protein HF521_021368 [Silurus meridionalis]
MGRCKLGALAWNRAENSGASENFQFTACALRLLLSLLLFLSPSRPGVHAPLRRQRHCAPEAAFQHERPARAGPRRARAADRERRLRRPERLRVRAHHHRPAAATHGQRTGRVRAARALYSASGAFSAPRPDRLLIDSQEGNEVNKSNQHEQLLDVFPRDLRQKEKFLKHLTGPLYFSPKCSKRFYRLYHNTRDCTIPAYYRRCARLLRRLAESQQCSEG